jgi:RNA recognition motif-containing protein
MRHDSGRHAEVTKAGPANSCESIDAEVTASVGLHQGGMFVGKRLFVGNLPHQVSNTDLNQLFSQFGSVQSVEIMQGRDARRNKGFGFVEMGSEAEAQAAIQGLHDREIDGRRFTVEEARLRKYRGGGVGGGGGFGGGGFGGGGFGSGGPSGRRW